MREIRRIGSLYFFRQIITNAYHYVFDNKQIEYKDAETTISFELS